MQSPNDPFSFLKSSWSGMTGGMPFASSALPTSDPEEIERRIANLKTVEQWLTFNLNMLKTTIQGLEIQLGTLAAIQSFRQAMGEMGKAPETEQPKEAALDSSALEKAAEQASWWWSSMQDQFNQLIAAAHNLQHQAEVSQGKQGPAEPSAKKPSARKKKVSAGAGASSRSARKEA